MDRVVSTPESNTNDSELPSHYNIQQESCTDDELYDGLSDFSIDENIVLEDIIIIETRQSDGIRNEPPQAGSSRKDTSNTPRNDALSHYSDSIAPPDREHTVQVPVNLDEFLTYAVVNPKENTYARDESNQDGDREGLVEIDNFTTEDGDLLGRNPGYYLYDEPVVQYTFNCPLYAPMYNMADESDDEEGAGQDDDNDDDQDYDQDDQDDQDSDFHDCGHHHYHEDLCSGHTHLDEEKEKEKVDISYSCHSESKIERDERKQRQNKTLLQIEGLLGIMADVHDETIVNSGTGNLAHRMSLEAIREEADNIHGEFCRKLRNEGLSIYSTEPQESYQQESYQREPYQQDLEEYRHLDLVHENLLRQHRLHRQQLQQQQDYQLQPDPNDTVGDSQNITSSGDGSRSIPQSPKNKIPPSNQFMPFGGLSKRRKGQGRHARPSNNHTIVAFTKLHIPTVELGCSSE